MDYRKKIKNLPLAPGVYLMKDEHGTVLYVGKADRLRQRVASYFRAGSRLDERKRILVTKIRDIDYIQTATSAEALLYENSLIKQLQPRYNSALKDSKTYPLLKLTVNEEFPRLFVTRYRTDDGARYFGPYSNAKLLHEAVKILHRLFPLRTCAHMPKKVCLNYHLHQCTGPCVGSVSRAQYQEMVDELTMFIEGKRAELLKLLAEKMALAARAQDFERATILRNRIEALSAVSGDKVIYAARPALEELQRAIGSDIFPERIEAFDISNTQGVEAVGSMVSFVKGKPYKDGYRRFKIETVSQIDDYGMMREVVRRRYAPHDDTPLALPDLIIIDGGKGHLAAAVGALDKLEMSAMPVIAIAKEFEHIYVKGRRDPLILPRDSKALLLIERIRDEAHRFAITYHKARLSKRINASQLDAITGIGIKRKRALLMAFGTIDNIKRATVDELLHVRGMNAKAAQAVISYFA